MPKNSRTDVTFLLVVLFSLWSRALIPGSGAGFHSVVLRGNGRSQFDPPPGQHLSGERLLATIDRGASTLTGPYLGFTVYAAHLQKGPGGAPELDLSGQGTAVTGGKQVLFYSIRLVQRLEPARDNPFSGTLEITGGAGRFKGATGSVQITGTGSGAKDTQYRIEGELTINSSGPLAPNLMGKRPRPPRPPMHLTVPLHAAPRSPGPKPN